MVSESRASQREAWWLEGELPISASATIATLLHSAHDNGFLFLDPSGRARAYSSGLKQTYNS